MNFLKKFGQVMLRIIGVVTGVMPILSQSLPAAVSGAVTRVEDKLTQAFNVIMTAETMFAAIGAVKAGPDKLKASVPFIAQLIQQSELVAGKKIENESLFTQGVTSITSGLADVLNSLRGDVKTQNSQDLPTAPGQ